MRTFIFCLCVLLVTGCASVPDKSSLFEAIDNSDVKSVEKYLKGVKNINELHPEDSITPLCYAIYKGEKDIAVSISETDGALTGFDDNNNPLLTAIMMKEYDLAAKFINDGIDINRCDIEENSALIYAVRRRSIEMVDLLVEKGLDINLKNIHGYTAKDYAILSGKKPVEDYITKLGGETYYKPFKDAVDGPFFEYNNDTVTGYYIRHSEAEGKTYVDKKILNSNDKKIKGWGGDDSYYDISAPTIEKSAYDNVNRILAIGDIHGQYDRLIKNLKGNSVIDNDLNWIYGDSHLVFVGDIFDRGDKVTEALWLIRKLEKQAEAKGGKVHLLIGNHENMVLKNDLRYIAPKYYALSYNSGVTFSQMFGENSFLGQWLRSKNVVMRINDIAFCHGGISKDLSDTGMTFEEINSMFRDILNGETMDKDLMKLLMRSKGPIWYRGYFKDNDIDVAAILKKYNANYVVVGHTEVESLNFVNNYPVIGVNIPLWNNSVPNQALLIENGKFYRVVEGTTVEELTL
ncbi:MAG: metallophosphoesterase [Bacteroidales bacterium]|nr:metallophosphoesterase [Bacteroidales bacterium]